MRFQGVEQRPESGDVRSARKYAGLVCFFCFLIIMYVAIFSTVAEAPAPINFRDMFILLYSVKAVWLPGRYCVTRRFAVFNVPF